MPEEVILDVETTSANPHQATPLLVGLLNGTVSISETLPLKIQGKTVIGHNLKYDLTVLRRAGVSFQDCTYEDTMIMSYLLFPNHPRGLKYLSTCFLKQPMKELLEVYNESCRRINPAHKDRKSLPDGWWHQVGTKTLTGYLESDLRSTARLYSYLRDKMAGKEQLEQWYDQVEKKVMVILASSELKGVKIDVENLKKLQEYFFKKTQLLEGKLKSLAGDKELNLNSSKQLQKVLYEKFKLRKGKKTKEGYSTDKATLGKLAQHHAFPKMLLEYREVQKLQSTYVDSILEKVDSGARLHSSYNQCLTKTQRLSSENPNLQNIPSKTEYGKRIKRCFIAEQGFYLLQADYSQVELRILAHLSQDPTLLSAFRDGKDLHKETADRMGIDRHTAKIINFSIIYGKTAFGFAQDWGVSIEEAQKTIDNYFLNFPAVGIWIRNQQDYVKKMNGWTKNIAELPLYVGDPFTPYRSEYESVMRQAVNFPIQSSSQCILKKALVNIFEKYRLVPVLTVHDSLVYEISNDSKVRKEDILWEMENAWKLDVPLKVDSVTLNRWE
jgi:DNA polymerase-1